MTRTAVLALLLMASLGLSFSTQADEGMWTFDNLPLKEMQSHYQFTPSADWLAHVQHAALRVKDGCSAAFVSADGLIITNQHCIGECLAGLSSPKHDYTSEGFYAYGHDQELRCPQMEMEQLTDTRDVTAQVAKRLKGLTGDDYVDAFRDVSSELEQACADGDARRWNCEVVDLYHGGRYALYKYQRYQDLRLVFTPEYAVAAFGGDPDNFNFPRYSLDVALLRAYDRDQPVQSEYLALATDTPKVGELVFTAGNPGNTARGRTLAELKGLRDDDLTPALIYYSELRGLLEQYSHEGPDQRRLGYANLGEVDNLIKSHQGQLEALQDQAELQRKAAEEQALRDWVESDPARKAEYGDPWSVIAAAEQRQHALITRYRMLEQAWGFESRLFDYARLLVRGAAERDKPNARRLPEFRDANLPQVEQLLFSDAPVSSDYEELMLGWSLTKLREALGADDPLVRKVLGRDSPGQFARRAVEGTQLDSAVTRQRMWNDPDFMDLSNDPLIVLAAKVDQASRDIRKQYEQQVLAVIRAQGEVIARARFARDGTDIYPDATFTLRLSYGQVQGWQEEDQKIPAFTDLAGLYARATGSAPFALPPRWLAAEPQLPPGTHLDFVTTNDIVGGSSGSPVINRDGKLVGLVFDGNIHSLGGDFWYDATENRAVAVDDQALLVALRKVYGMNALADELVTGHIQTDGLAPKAAGR
ncbi:MAG TPA: S46 family peptidase [Gammaproteobacteria bacterium]|nr:S46 family peptidase [Gammaproteobacteria bacterium]